MTYSKTQVAKALSVSYGIVTEAAKRLKCARGTIYNHMADDTAGILAKAREDGHEILGDKLQMKAIDDALDGNTSLLMFLLRTLFADRGFVEQKVVHLVEGRMQELSERIVAHLVEAGRDDVIDVLAEVIDEVVEEERQGQKRLR